MYTRREGPTTDKEVSLYDRGQGDGRAGGVKSQPVTVRGRGGVQDLQERR